MSSVADYIEFAPVLRSGEGGMVLQGWNTHSNQPLFYYINYGNKEIIMRSIYFSDMTQAMPCLSVATDNLSLTLSQNIYSYSNKHNVPYSH